MVFIYKMSKVLEKQNGINPTCYRKVYYRTVYYKTLKGKEGWKNLRCRIFPIISSYLLLLPITSSNIL